MKSAATTETIDDGHRPTLPRNGLPNGLIDDPGIGMTALFLAAFKASRGEKFTLNQTDVKKRFGIGTTAFQSAIRELRAGRRYDRHQPRQGQARQFAVDKFSTDQPGRLGYLIVRGEMFSMFENADDAGARADLVKACAVLIYLLSHAPTITVEIRHVRRRFNLSRPTASKWLKFLAERHMIWHLSDEREGGQFTPQRYTAHIPDFSMSNSPTVLLPVMGHQVTQKELGINLTKDQTKEIYQQPHMPVADAAGISVDDRFDPDEWIHTHEYFDARDNRQQRIRRSGRSARR